MRFDHFCIIGPSIAASLVMFGHGTANACDPSGWILAVTPAAPCLSLAATDDRRLEVHNDCSELLEIAPEGCDEPCSEVVRVDANAAAFLALPATPEDGDRKVFDYNSSQQTGSIELTYLYNNCSSTEERGCSAASTAGTTTVPEVGVCLAFVALVGRRAWSNVTAKCPTRSRVPGRARR